MAFGSSCVWLTGLWILVYGGANWITSLHSYRIRLHFELERSFPFVPATAVIYLSLFPMLWLAPIVMQTAERLNRFAKALACLMILSGIGFLLLPAEQVHSPKSPDGLIGRVFQLADSINLTHNYLPSLHVGMGVLCAFAYGRCDLPRAITLLFWSWAVAIAASTLLLHQHYLVDVVTGGLLGWIVARAVCGKRGQL